MEKRTHLYVSRKHVCLWLMAVCMLASLVSRIVLFSSWKDGLWMHILLPGIPALLYTLVTIASGDELFHRTSFPVWLMGIAGAIRLHRIMAPDLKFWLVCIALVVICGIYQTVVGGKLPRFCLTIFAFGALAVVLILHQIKLLSANDLITEGLMVLSLIVLLPGIKVHDDDAYHPFPGDRADGRRVRTCPLMSQITPYFMVGRNESTNLFSEAVEITPIEQYIRQKRKEGLTGFGFTHVLMAAYVRTIAKYPYLNRFIAGQKIYSHGKDIILCMVVKREMSLTSPDSVIKLHMDPSDTAEILYQKFTKQVAEAKDDMADNALDNTMSAFLRIPGVLLRMTYNFLEFLDYFGCLPRFLLEVSPFHGSAFFTALGSLGIQPIYHHLYDFGTIPVFCAFGSKRKAVEIVDGEPVTRKYVDVKFNLDERICDGFYYATAIKYMLRVLRHPEVLDGPPEELNHDIP